MKEEEHMHGPFSLQYCIQNTVQPNDRSSDFEHTTENDSRHENVNPSTASTNPDIDSNFQLQYSLESAAQTDSPNYNSSRQFSVSLDSENPVQVGCSIYQDSRMTMVTSRQNESNTRASDCHLGLGNDTASVATENTERPRHSMYEQCSSRVASCATWRQFELFDIAALAQAGFYSIAIQRRAYRGKRLGGGMKKSTSQYRERGDATRPGRRVAAERSTHRRKVLLKKLFS